MELEIDEARELRKAFKTGLVDNTHKEMFLATRTTAYAVYRDYQGLIRGYCGQSDKGTVDALDDFKDIEDEYCVDHFQKARECIDIYEHIEMMGGLMREMGTIPPKFKIGGSDSLKGWYLEGLQETVTMYYMNTCIKHQHV